MYVLFLVTIKILGEFCRVRVACPLPPSAVDKTLVRDYVCGCVCNYTYEYSSDITETLALCYRVMILVIHVYRTCSETWLQ